MFDFLSFWLEGRGPGGAQRYREIHHGLQKAADAGVPREEINRRFYRVYQGEAADEVAAAGQRWFTNRAADPDFFIHSTMRALHAHRAAGAQLVLVSGSFEPCLAPIARTVEARLILCTRPGTRGGRYTGHVPEPVIGDGKARAVRRLLDEHPGVRAEDCWAYGDHLSDLPMLRLVGHPVAVGDDPSLIAALAQRQPAEGTLA
ncbi:HAD-IB family hydrolase [Streptomyces sp. TRM68367]|nr:HAD-IB family hydrolase [Streptomyces sp. TRM68367]